MPAEAEFLAPLAISVAQGWCKVMAYIHFYAREIISADRRQ